MYTYKYIRASKCNEPPKCETVQKGSDSWAVYILERLV